MWIDDGEYIIRCGCGDIEHPVHLYFDTWHFKGVEHQELDIGISIETTSFWKRIKNAVLYIFKERKIWNMGNVSLNLHDSKQKAEIVGLIGFLHQCLEKAEKVHERIEEG